MLPRPQFPPPRCLAAAVILAGAALAGCQGDPLTRLADVPDPSTQLGAGGIIWINPQHGSAEPMGWGGSGTRTFALSASRGGTFKFDRYTVSFPPGAVGADASVTITVPSSVIVECELSISPPSQNRFLQPVTLTMDLHNTNATAGNIGGVSIFWRGPGGWTRMPTQVDVGQM